MKVVSLVLFLLPAIVEARNNYCDNAPFFFFPGGPTQSSGHGWASGGGNSVFRTGWCLMVSGIHIAQTHKKTVLVIDRTDYKNTYLSLPGSKMLAYAEELKLDSGAQRALNVRTNTFCSTGQFLPDGTLLNLGGDYGMPGDGTSGDGAASVRSFTPCTDNSCDFELIGSMTSRRWYPTGQLLPDGRILVVGGSIKGADINANNLNNPTIEYWPRGPGEGNHHLDFLQRTLPFNLYPFVHLLPSGRVFIFAQDSYILFDTTTNQEVPGYYPPIRAHDAVGANVYFSYPVAGTSALLPLSSSNQYQAEIIVCGGNSQRSRIVAHSAVQTLQNSYIGAHDQCWTILPETPNPSWAAVSMGSGRVMGNAVLLPDGNVLIINGARQGHSGIPNYAHAPNLSPVMFDPKSRAIYTNLATSKVPRVYHASALLLHDATVLITGSNPNTKIVQGPTEFPTEFRSEYFFPPYFKRGASPQLYRVPKSVAINTQFSVFFKVFQASGIPMSKRLKFVLAHAGFSTHGANHGMRNIVLDVVRFVGHGPGFKAILQSPPNRTICPPTFYWLFVLDNSVPNRDGQAVFVS